MLGAVDPLDPEFLVNNLFPPALSGYSCSEQETLTAGAWFLVRPAKERSREQGRGQSPI